MSDSDESFSSVEREEGEGRVERKLSTFSDFSDGDDLDILEALKEAEKAAQRPVESKSGDEGTPPPPVLNTSDEEGSSPPVPRRAPPGFSLEVDADSEEEELDSPLPPPPALDSSLSSEGEEGGEAPPPLLSAGEKGKEGEAGVKHNQSGMESPCSAESDGEGGEVAKKEVEAAASVLDEIEPVLNSARSAANDAQPKMEGGAKASEKKEEAYAAASSSKPSSAIGSGEGAKLGGGRGGGGVERGGEGEGQEGEGEGGVAAMFSSLSSPRTFALSLSICIPPFFLSSSFSSLPSPPLLLLLPLQLPLTGSIFLLFLPLSPSPSFPSLSSPCRF
mmetsp:Transcript_7726/g.20059  ORF Transcript_7726/g.20059 Transcript_7726/m.20059 type:complete len:333 (+) Transcript_7726:112-1110(+)